MSNKQQTAVEWFFSELERMQYFIGNDMLQAYKQAKEMHKQEIINVYGIGLMRQKVYEYPSPKISQAEQYYKETYEQ